MNSPEGWGTQLQRARVRDYDTLVYTPRARHLLEVLELSERWGDREFIVDGALRLTYLEHRRGVRRVARCLAEHGVTAGDRVFLLAANSAEWMLTFWAVIELGGVLVLGNAWWSEEQVAHAIATTQPRVAVVDARRETRLDPSVCRVRIERLADVLAGGPQWSGVTVRAGEDDAAIVLFTSGTSGSPKGAVLSHRSLIANQHGFLALTGRLPSQLSTDHPASRVLVSAPLFHTGGVQAVLSGILTGTTMVLLSGRFEPDRVLELIETERITAWSGVPTAVQRVVEHPDALRRDLTSLRSLGLGGAPLPLPLVRRAAEAFPNVAGGASTNYGMTEAGGIVSSASGRQAAAHPGCSGRVLDAIELRIHGATGTGEAGEILVRSAALMTGYWGETETPIDADGWLHTGDVGYLDDDGYLYVVDRVKDVIIRGGENIATAHVESALLTHPDVAAVAVVALAHPDLGEEVGAVVLPRAGSDVEALALRDYAASRLAHFEVPARWWIRCEPFPMTASQKVDKRQLRREWAALGAGQRPAR